MEVKFEDTLNSNRTYQSFMAKAIEEYNKSDSINNYFLESQSSDYNEDSKTSSELDGIIFSQEMEKIFSKHLKQSSVIENNVKNNYQGILNSFKNTSLGKINEVPYEDKENTQKISKKAETKKSSDSYTQVLIDNSKMTKELSNTKKPIKGNIHNSLRNSTFALTNRIYCLKCCAEVYTSVSHQMKNMSLWSSINFFIEAVKCCGEPRVLSRYQEIVHTCKVCGSVLAKISTN
jgi:LITAF-like zinc ribbon domain